MSPETSPFGPFTPAVVSLDRMTLARTLLDCDGVISCCDGVRTRTEQ